MEFMPNNAPLVVLMFLGTCFALGVAGAACVLLKTGKGRWKRSRVRSIGFTQPIRPGESYTATLVFDLPPNVKNPRLYITTLPCLTWALIGHENSLSTRRFCFS